jgi:uncharacterized Zn-finger protein
MQKNPPPFAPISPYASHPHAHHPHAPPPASPSAAAASSQPPSRAPVTSAPHSVSYNAPVPRTSSVLTPPSGVTSDGLSPLSSSVHTGSSQGSQGQGGLGPYYGSSGAGWPTQANSSYTFSSAAQSQSGLAQPQYGSRSNIYGQPPAMSFNGRSSQSPATTVDGLPGPPPYDQSVHQPFSGGSAPSNPPSLPSQAPPPHGTMLNSHNLASSQAPPPATGPAPVDHYAHSRPPPTPAYYSPASTPHQSTFSSYPPQPSPTQHSPTTAPGQARQLPSHGLPSGMAHPQPYRGYPSYPSHAMAGPIMSNITNPGGQMSLVPGMSMPGYSHMGHHMYTHGQPPPQAERPFKCDQCPQSFNRNHDLKRHKRIHLAVKPFPCTFCDKSFSRKDALKVSRSVPISFILCRENICQDVMKRVIIQCWGFVDHSLVGVMEGFASKGALQGKDGWKWAGFAMYGLWKSFTNQFTGISYHGGHSLCEELELC